MYLFRMNLRERLPLLFLIVIFVSFVGKLVVSIIQTVQGLDFIYLVFSVLSSLPLIVLGIVLYLNRFRDHWMTKNLAFFFLIIMIFPLLYLIINYIYLDLEFDVKWMYLLLNIIPYIIPILIVILTNEKGMLADLFRKNTRMIDRIFFLFYFGVIFISILTALSQILYYYLISGYTGFPRTFLGYNILILFLIAIPTILNFVISDQIWLSKYFNPIYSLVICLFVLILGTSEYLVSLQNSIGENDPFVLLDYLLSQTRFWGIGVCLLFYAIVKFIHQPEPKMENEVLSEVEGSVVLE